MGTVLKVLAALMVIVGTAFFIMKNTYHKGNEQERKPILTQEQALASLREAWKISIKNEVGSHPSAEDFARRLSETEEEIKQSWYEAKLMPFPEARRLLQREDGGSPLFLYGDTGRLPTQGLCWVLTWKNLLAGGYVAYLDATTGQVFAIEILIEG